MIRVGNDIISILIAWVIVTLCALPLFLWLVSGTLELDPNILLENKYFLAAYAYISISSLIGLKILRNPLITWYANQVWFTAAVGGVDLLFKQIARRIGFEIFITGLSFIFSPIGLWIYAVFRKSEPINNDLEQARDVDTSLSSDERIQKLESLARLKETGALSDDEFRREKKRLLEN